ncbi:GGDEF domain-containing protein [Shewanella sp. AS16]|uniref:GGDEF domain-containing protein n=1 Tax=Shewanella sp. AS16 TaxID=2907625 RepID=UPI001F42C5F6|nr:GGDEF domain-containing protein [Shewanella sp. AS16]MCE9687151.1 GGDEF domain-containing protein [Shewanella sp. AS16]
MSAIEYVFVTMLLVNLMLGSVFLVSWLSISRKTYVLLWSLTFWLATLNVLTNAGRELFSSNQTYWIFVNSLSLLVQGFALAGYRQRAGWKAFPGWLFGYGLTIEVVLFYFTVLQPHFGIRVALLPFSALLMSLACIYTLCQAQRKLRPAEWSCATMLGLFALVETAVCGVALMHGVEQQQAYTLLYQKINYLTMPAAYAGLGAFSVLMLADDLAAKMRSLAYTDDLTKLLNRRGLNEAFRRRLSKNAKQPDTTFIAVADIDHFKAINDSHGHEVGDLALKTVARVLEQHTREQDLVGRLGGEEFALVLQAEDLPSAAAMIDHLRAVIETETFHVQGQALKMTASFGLVQYRPQQRNVFDAIHLADALLYQAKNNGRNRVEVQPI